MPNDFSGDSDCVMLLNIDNGAIPTDSKGTNVIGNVLVTNNTSIFKQGDASGSFAGSARLNCSDANMQTDNPWKNGGDANKDFTFCFWYYPTAFSGVDYIVDKGWTGTYNFALYNSGGAITGWWGWNSGNSITYLGTGAVASLNQWYHIMMQYRDSDYKVRYRVWDDTAQAVISTTAWIGPVGGSRNVENATWLLGNSTFSSAPANGLYDEGVLFKSLLTYAQVEFIQQGIFPGIPPSPPSPPDPTAIKIMNPYTRNHNFALLQKGA